MHKTCVIIDYIQSWGAFVAMVGAGVTFFMVWGVNKSTVFTYGQPMPMFLEGGCLCNGELCPDVLFTFNLSLPPSGETVKDEDAYWETWRETVWWDLDGNHPGFSVAGASTPEDDLLFFKYGSCTNTLALSMLGIDHDQCTSMLRKQLLEEAQPGDELLFEVVAPHELADNGTGLPCGDMGYPWEKTNWTKRYPYDMTYQWEDGPYQGNGEQTCRMMSALRVMSKKAADHDGVVIQFDNTLAELFVNQTTAFLRSPICGQGP